MGKVPIRLKEVVYTLSPFQQSVMGGLWKDLPHKAAHHAHNVSLGRAAGRVGLHSGGGGGWARQRRHSRPAALDPQIARTSNQRAAHYEGVANVELHCRSQPEAAANQRRLSPATPAPSPPLPPPLPPPTLHPSVHASRRPQMKDFVLYCVAPIAGIAYYCADL